MVYNLNDLPLTLRVEEVAEILFRALLWNLF